MKSGLEWFKEGEEAERAGKLTVALEAYRNSAKAEPRVAAPWIGLAQILEKNQQPRDALECLKRAVVAEPNNPLAMRRLARSFHGVGDVASAEAAYKRSLTLDPQSNSVLLGLAQLYEDMGDSASAADQYRILLHREPTHAEAIHGLLGLHEHIDVKTDFARAERAMKVAQVRDKALIGYGLGKALDKNGEYDRAFEMFTLANTARQEVAGKFDRVQFDARIENYLSLLNKQFFEARSTWGANSDKPVLVVGLPRSGTTLTEQVIGSHPQCFGAGELPILSDLATGTPDRLEPPRAAWPDNAWDLDETHIRAIGEDYSAQTARLAPADTIRIVDKQPLNFWHLGLVAIALPNAKVIHCTRDIRDVGLSIYSQNFHLSQRWSTSLEDIAYYQQGYLRLMRHWEAVAGLDMMIAAYEDTVSDLETQARKLLSFLELNWNDRVLSFHTNNRAVQTPSRWQVRQPLYQSSRAKWRHYESHLGPLMESAVVNKS
ncbi:MAG: sulfotransferase [Pseudomonadota bacterium]